MPATERVNIILAAMYTGLRIGPEQQMAFAYSLRAPTVCLPLPAYEGSPNMIAASRFFSENGGEGGQHFLAQIQHLAELHQAQFNRSLTPDEEKAYLEYYELLFRSLLLANGASAPGQEVISPQDTLDLLRVRQWAISDASPESPLEIIGPDLVELGLDLFAGMPGRLHPQSAPAGILGALLTGLDGLAANIWTNFPDEDLQKILGGLFLETGAWILEKRPDQTEHLRSPSLITDMFQIFLHTALPHFEQLSDREEAQLQYRKIWKASLNRLISWQQHRSPDRWRDQNDSDLLQTLYRGILDFLGLLGAEPSTAPSPLSVDQIEYLLDQFLHACRFDPATAKKISAHYWEQWPKLWQLLQKYGLTRISTFEQLFRVMASHPISATSPEHPHPLIPALDSWFGFWQKKAKLETASSPQSLKNFTDALFRPPLQHLLVPAKDTATYLLPAFMDHLWTTLEEGASTLTEDPEVLLATLISTGKIGVQLPGISRPNGQEETNQAIEDPWDIILREVIPLQETLHWVQSGMEMDTHPGLPGDAALVQLFRATPLPEALQTLRFMGSEVLDLAGEPDIDREEFAGWIKCLLELQRDQPLLAADSGTFFRFGNALHTCLFGKDKPGNRSLYRAVLKRIASRLDYFWESDPAMSDSKNQLYSALEQIREAFQADKLQPTWSHQLTTHQYQTLLLSTLDQVLHNPCWIRDRQLQKGLTAILIAVPFERPPDRVPFEILRLTIERVLQDLRQQPAWLKKITIEENTQHYPLSYALEWLFQSILSKNTGCRARLLAPPHFSVLLRFVLDDKQKAGLSLRSIDETALQLNEHLNQFANGKSELADMLEALQL